MMKPFALATACLACMLVFLPGPVAAEEAHVTIEVSVPRGFILGEASFALKDRHGNTIEPVYCDSLSWLRTSCEVTVDIGPGLYRIEGEVGAYKRIRQGGRGRYADARYSGRVSFSTHRRDISFGGRLQGKNITHCGRDRCPLIKSFYVKAPPKPKRPLTEAQKCDKKGGLVCGNYCAMTCYRGGGNLRRPGGVIYKIR